MNPYKNFQLLCLTNISAAQIFTVTSKQYQFQVYLFLRDFAGLAQ